MLSLGSDDGLRVWHDGKESHTSRKQRPVKPDQDKATLQLHPGTNHLLLKVVNADGGAGFYFRVIEADVPADIAPIVAKAPPDRTEEERTMLAKYHRGIAPLLNPAREQLAVVEKERKEVDGVVLRTLVAMAGEPRMTRVLPRGNWLNESGERRYARHAMRF